MQNGIVVFFSKLRFVCVEMYLDDEKNRQVGLLAIKMTIICTCYTVERVASSYGASVCRLKKSLAYACDRRE